MTLIKDSKKSTVAQYIRKTLAKKRLSVEKAAASAGGGESAKSGGDAADQKKEESEKFVSLLSKVCLILRIQYNIIHIQFTVHTRLFDNTLYIHAVNLSLSLTPQIHTHHTYTGFYHLSTWFQYYSC